MASTVFLLLIAFLPTPASAAILSRPPNNLGLVGYWKFDEGAGTTASDSSGSGNTGTLINAPAWTTGQLGQALAFNGTNQYVSIPGISAFGQNPISISAWIKVNPAQINSYGLAVGIGNGSNGKLLYVGWVQNAQVGTGNSIGGGGYGRNYGSGITDRTKFHHVVITSSGGSSQTISLYVDGALTNTGTENFNLTVSGGKIGAGDDLNVLNYYLNGSVDDVRIYNRALSQADVTALYNLGAAKLSTAKRDVSPTTFLTNGLVGYWTFDGHTVNWGSNTVSDVSGNGNTGTLVNMSTSTSPTVGKIGQALRFNGTNQYVTAGQPAALYPSNQVTISAWIYAKSNTQNGAIAAAWAGGGGAGSYILYVGQDAALSKFAFAINQSNGTNIFIYPNTAFNANQWYYVVGVADGSNIRIYINGADTGTVASYNGTLRSTANANVNIGSFSGGSYPFNGTIDDVRIYNRALSATEIQELYQAGGGVTQDASNPQVLTNGGLVGHWSFDGKYMNWATNQALDSSGQGNNGTLVNMSTTTSPTRGVIGQALSFNGTSSTVTISNATSLQLNGSFSACVWTRIESSATQVILEQWYPSVGWHIGIASNVIFSDVDGTNANRIQSGTLLLHTWYDVCLIYNGTSQTLYINGSSVASHASGASPGSSQPIYIGSNGVNSFFSGALDDVRIYNRALSPQEVQTLYDLGR